jgi:hypothetical protein
MVGGAVRPVATGPAFRAASRTSENCKAFSRLVVSPPTGSPSLVVSGPVNRSTRPDLSGKLTRVGCAWRSHVPDHSPSIRKRSPRRYSTKMHSTAICAQLCITVRANHDSIAGVCFALNENLNFYLSDVLRMHGDTSWSTITCVYCVQRWHGPCLAP